MQTLREWTTAAVQHGALPLEQQAPHVWVGARRTADSAAISWLSGARFGSQGAPFNPGSWSADQLPGTSPRCLAATVATNASIEPSIFSERQCCSALFGLCERPALWTGVPKPAADVASVAAIWDSSHACPAYWSPVPWGTGTAACSASASSSSADCSNAFMCVRDIGLVTATWTAAAGACLARGGWLPSPAEVQHITAWLEPHVAPGDAQTAWTGWAKPNTAWVSYADTMAATHVAMPWAAGQPGAGRAAAVSSYAPASLASSTSAHRAVCGQWPASSPDRLCPHGWTFMASSCWYMNTTDVYQQLEGSSPLAASATAARAACAAQGGRLPSTMPVKVVQAVAAAGYAALRDAQAEVLGAAGAGTGWRVWIDCEKSGTWVWQDTGANFSPGSYSGAVGDITASNQHMYIALDDQLLYNAVPTATNVLLMCELGCATGWSMGANGACIRVTSGSLTSAEAATDACIAEAANVGLGRMPHMATMATEQQWRASWRALAAAGSNVLVEMRRVDSTFAYQADGDWWTPGQLAGGSPAKTHVMSSAGATSSQHCLAVQNAAGWLPRAGSLPIAAGLFGVNCASGLPAQVLCEYSHRHDCPAGWQAWNGRCLYWHTAVGNLAAKRAACQATAGADVSSVVTHAENQMIKAQLLASLAVNDDAVYMGGYRNVSATSSTDPADWVFYWFDGRPFAVTAWSSGEPNDYQSWGEYAISYGTYTGKMKEWNDVEDTVNGTAVCKRHGPPMPYSVGPAQDPVKFAEPLGGCAPSTTPTPVLTASPSLTPTPSQTPSMSGTATASPTVTVTASGSVTASSTASFSPSPSTTPSVTSSVSASVSCSATANNTASVTPTMSTTPRSSVSSSVTASITSTPSITASGSAHPSTVPSLTALATLASTPTPQSSTLPTTTPGPSPGSVHTGSGRGSARLTVVDVIPSAPITMVLAATPGDGIDGRLTSRVQLFLRAAGYGTTWSARLRLLASARILQPGLAAQSLLAHGVNVSAMRGDMEELPQAAGDTAPPDMLITPRFGSALPSDGTVVTFTIAIDGTLRASLQAAHAGLHLWSLQVVDQAMGAVRAELPVLVIVPDASLLAVPAAIATQLSAASINGSGTLNVALSPRGAVSPVAWRAALLSEPALVTNSELPRVASAQRIPCWIQARATAGSLSGTPAQVAALDSASRGACAEFGAAGRSAAAATASQCVWHVQQPGDRAIRLFLPLSTTALVPGLYTAQVQVAFAPLYFEPGANQQRLGAWAVLHVPVKVLVTAVAVCPEQVHVPTLRAPRAGAADVSSGDVTLENLSLDKVLLLAWGSAAGAVAPQDPLAVQADAPLSSAASACSIQAGSAGMSAGPVDSLQRSIVRTADLLRLSAAQQARANASIAAVDAALATEDRAPWLHVQPSYGALQGIGVGTSVQIQWQVKYSANSSALLAAREHEVTVALVLWDSARARPEIRALRLHMQTLVGHVSARGSVVRRLSPAIPGSSLPVSVPAFSSSTLPGCRVVAQLVVRDAFGLPRPAATTTLQAVALDSADTLPPLQDDLSSAMTVLQSSRSAVAANRQVARVALQQVRAGSFSAAQQLAMGASGNTTVWEVCALPLRAPQGGIHVHVIAQSLPASEGSENGVSVTSSSNVISSAGGAPSAAGSDSSSGASALSSEWSLLTENSPVVVSSQPALCAGAGQELAPDGLRCRCVPGWAAAASGDAVTSSTLQCVPCAVGTFSFKPTILAAHSSDVCRPCGAGWFSPPGSSRCFACPARGAVCTDGSMRVEAGFALAEDGERLLESVVKQALIQAPTSVASSFELSTASLPIIVACPNAFSCEESSSSAVTVGGGRRLSSPGWANSSYHVVYDTFCADGHTSLLCGTCKPGWQFFPAAAGALAQCMQCRAALLDAVTVVLLLLASLSVLGVFSLAWAQALQDVAFEATTSAPRLKLAKLEVELDGLAKQVSAFIARLNNRLSSRQSSKPRPDTAGPSASPASAVARPVSLPLLRAFVLATAMAFAQQSELIDELRLTHLSSTWAQAAVAHVFSVVPTQSFAASCLLDRTSTSRMTLRMLEGAVLPPLAVLLGGAAGYAAAALWNRCRQRQADVAQPEHDPEAGVSNGNSPNKPRRRAVSVVAQQQAAGTPLGASPSSSDGRSTSQVPVRVAASAGATLAIFATAPRAVSSLAGLLSTVQANSRGSDARLVLDWNQTAWGASHLQAAVVAAIGCVLWGGALALLARLCKSRQSVWTHGVSWLWKMSRYGVGWWWALQHALAMTFGVLPWLPLTRPAALFVACSLAIAQLVLITWLSPHVAPAVHFFVNDGRWGQLLPQEKAAIMTALIASSQPGLRSQLVANSVLHTRAATSVAIAVAVQTAGAYIAFSWQSGGVLDAVLGAEPGGVNTNVAAAAPAQAGSSGSAHSLAIPNSGLSVFGGDQQEITLALNLVAALVAAAFWVAALHLVVLMLPWHCQRKAWVAIDQHLQPACVTLASCGMHRQGSAGATPRRCAASRSPAGKRSFWRGPITASSALQEQSRERRRSATVPGDCGSTRRMGALAASALADSVGSNREICTAAAAASSPTASLALGPAISTTVPALPPAMKSDVPHSPSHPKPALRLSGRQRRQSAVMPGAFEGLLYHPESVQADSPASPTHPPASPGPVSGAVAAADDAQPGSHALPPLQLSGRQRRRSVVMPGAFVGLVPPPASATTSISSDGSDGSVTRHCSSDSSSSSDAERAKSLGTPVKPARARRAAFQSAGLAGLHSLQAPADARGSCNARAPSAPPASSELAAAPSHSVRSPRKGRHSELQSVDGLAALPSMSSSTSIAQQPVARARRAGLGHYLGPSLASMECLREQYQQLGSAVEYGSSSSDDEVYG